MVLHLMAYILPGLLAAAGVPLALGMVPANALYGFRTPKTRSSPSIWYPANRFAGWVFVASGAVAAAFNLALWMLQPDWPVEKLVLWMGSALTVVVLAGTAVSFGYLSKL